MPTVPAVRRHVADAKPADATRTFAFGRYLAFLLYLWNHMNDSVTFLYLILFLVICIWLTKLFFRLLVLSLDFHGCQDLFLFLYELVLVHVIFIIVFRDRLVLQFALLHRYQVFHSGIVRILLSEITEWLCDLDLLLTSL